MKSPILGSSYVARSVNAADNRMVNLFPEIVPEGGKEPAFLRRCPGLTSICSALAIGANRVAGVHYLNRYIYVITGTNLFKIDPSSPSIVTATFALPFAVSVITRASIADNGTQIFFACLNDLGQHISYLFNTVTSAITAVTAATTANFPAGGAVTVVFMDGYFVINEWRTQKVYVSALYDGLTWSALGFASAERSPDNVVGLATNNGELWVFGASTTEVWYNAGSPNFPFAPIQGAYSETGCVNAYCIAKIDNALFWVGTDARGRGIVYRSRGYSGERVSNFYIENEIAYQIDFNASVSQDSLAASVAYTYQMRGHSFYVLTAPDNGGTGITLGPGWDRSYVYDVSTQGWHERQSINPNSGLPDFHWGFCYTNISDPDSASSYGVVGSYFGGLYIFSDTEFADGAYQQIWLRSWRALPTGANNLNRSAHHSLQIDCETGMGDHGGNPSIFLRWSDDGGHTWSVYKSQYLGFLGDYSKRVIWRRLGMTTKLRDRVYEVSGGNNHPMNIMGAELILSPTNA